MTIYTFPLALWRIGKLQFSLLSISATSQQSALNPIMFTDGPTSEFWQVEAELTSQFEDDWRDVSALLRKLRGRRNKVRLFDPSRGMRGAGGASPTLNVRTNAATGATSITLYGLVPSQAVAIAADDQFSVGENLYAASDDAPSNADGEATVSFLPPLRFGAAEGDPVGTYYPTGVFQLRDGGNSGMVVPGRREPLTLQFMEDPEFD